MSKISKIYTYKNCGSCRKAVNFLKERDVRFQETPIRERPPSVSELKKMLHIMGGDLKRLFNTSGGDYKAMSLKDKLAKMSEIEALDLLASNGNLVKRPFVLTENEGLVGFKEPEWIALFG